MQCEFKQCMHILFKYSAIHVSLTQRSCYRLSRDRRLWPRMASPQGRRVIWLCNAHCSCLRNVPVKPFWAAAGGHLLLNDIDGALLSAIFSAKRKRGLTYVSFEGWWNRIFADTYRAIFVAGAIATHPGLPPIEMCLLKIRLVPARQCWTGGSVLSYINPVYCLNTQYLLYLQLQLLQHLQLKL